MLKFTSLGGAGTVTGSKHLLEHDGKRILVDCGLFQGLKNLRELNWEPLPIAPSSIDAVVLTHAHLDHSGYLPKLVGDGFQGKIFATDATHDVAKLILRDSGFLQEKGSRWRTRPREILANPVRRACSAARRGNPEVQVCRTHSGCRHCRYWMGRQAGRVFRGPGAL